MLGRRGCCRTGLELCKFILSIDRSDPLFVIGTIDYFAIRSKQYRYLLDFFTTYKEKSVLLPNLFYSSALASFHLSFVLFSFLYYYYYYYYYLFVNCIIDFY